jgi:hypothetical protein
MGNRMGTNFVPWAAAAAAGSSAEEEDKGTIPFTANDWD